MPEMNVKQDGNAIKDATVAQDIPEVTPSKAAEKQAAGDEQTGKTAALTAPKSPEPKKPVDVKKGTDKKQGKDKRNSDSTAAAINPWRRDQAELVES